MISPRHQFGLPFTAAWVPILLFTQPVLAQEANSFPTRTEVPENRFMYSQTNTVEGLSGVARVSVSGGRNSQFSIDGESFTNDPSDIRNGQSLTIRHVSAIGSLIPTTTNVSIGGQLRSFTTITPEIEEPLARDDAFVVPRNLAFQQAAPGVLANDDPADRNSITVELVEGPANGLLTLNADGSFLYSPVTDFIGLDTFRYRIAEQPDAIATATLDVRIVPRVAVLDAVSSAEDQSGPDTAQRFELRLTQPSDIPVVVRVQTVSDSADGGFDFAAVNQEIEIPAGERRAFFAVPLIDDNEIEPDEAYRVEIVAARAATIDPDLRSANARIVDNDPSNACNPLPATGLCVGKAEGTLDIPIGVPLGGYLRPPIGGEYVPGLEAFGEGDAAPFFNAFAGFIPEVSEGGGANSTPPNEARTSVYSTFSPSSRGYLDSLAIKSLALHQGGETVVFVKLDTIGMIDEIAVAVADVVEQQTGLALGDRLIMSASHTHDGPGAIGNRSVKYFWAALDTYHHDLFERVVENIANVVIASLENPVPARFGYTTGQDSTGANSFRRSRSPYPPERVSLQNQVRQRIGVFRIDEIDAAGEAVRPLAMMVNFAAHGIVFDVENLYFSGDCLGGLERSLQSRFDTPVMVMHIQGSGGDVSPRADGSPKRQRMERFGEQMAPQIIDLFNDIDNFDTSPTLRVVSQRFVLNRQTLGYAPGEYPFEFGAVQCNADFEGSGNCVPANPNGADDEADNGVAENDSFVPQDTKISVIQVGSSVMMAQPGEPLAEYGLQLMEASPFGQDNSFVWGYSLDHVGYILPDLKADWDLGGTEGTTTFWGWKQGGRMLDVTNDLLQALHNGSEPPPDEFAISYADQPAADKTPTTSPNPGTVQLQPTNVQRFDRTIFRFEGGDPIIDLPVVTLEEEVDDTFITMRRFDSRSMNQFYEFWIDYILTNGSHGYTIEFEPAKNFPVGRYRFRVDGVAALGPGTTDYSVTTDAFVVSEATNLLLENLTRSGDNVSATLSYTAVPDNYRLVDPVGSTSLPAPVRQGRVAFTLGDETVESSTPTISSENGRTLATFTVELPGAEIPSAFGEDIWGNRSE